MYLNEQFFCGQSQWNDGFVKVKDVYFDYPK